MTYNLTPNQKTVAKEIVALVRAGSLPEEFMIGYVMQQVNPIFFQLPGRQGPALTDGTLVALAAAGLLIYQKSGSSTTQVILLGAAYTAVDSDFDAPDQSFLIDLSPLSDTTNLDPELQDRCLPILAGPSLARPKWDSACRTASVILDERLRDVAGIADRSLNSQQIVNDAFGERGTLAGKFSQASLRSGYRDLFAGMVGVFRNPSAHGIVDPTPEEGGAYIVFVDLLLKRLERMR